jgi:TM2 domain-containing membrane protein YozV
MDHENYPKKRLWLAYLLAVPIGCLGAHRFYLGRNRTATLILSLWAVGFFLSWGVAMARFPQPKEAMWDSAAGLLMLSAWTWELIDLFFLPGMVRLLNKRKAEEPARAT